MRNRLLASGVTRVLGNECVPRRPSPDFFFGGGGARGETLATKITKVVGIC